MKLNLFSQAVLIVLLLALSKVDYLGGMPGQEPDQQNPVARAEELLSEIQVRFQELQQFRNQLPGLVGEDSVLIARRIARRQEELGDLVDVFIQQLISAREAGQPVDALVDTASSVLAQAMAVRQARIVAYESQVVTLRLGRTTATGEDLLDLEREVANENADLDEQIEIYLIGARRYEPLGLDPQPQFAYFDSLVNARAAETAERIRLTLQSRDDLRDRIRESPEDEAMALAQEMRALAQRLDGNVTTLSAMADLMEERGFTTAAYRQLLVSTTGELTSDILNTRVALGLIQEALVNFRTWMVTTGVQLLLKLVVFLIIVTLFRYLARMTTRVVERALATSKLSFSSLLKDAIVSVVGKAVLLVGIMVGLSQIGVQLGPLLAGLGVIGFIIGFALQDTLSNFASGAMIVIYRPFDIGDVVEAGGVFGKVDAMTLVSTGILTFDNQRLTVPNRKIWGEVIRNVTSEATRRVDLAFSVGYSESLDRAEEVLHQIVTDHPLVLQDPEPLIKVNALAESSVEFVVRPWCKTDDYWSVYWDLTRSVKAVFESEGIRIPFPQQDVHLYQQPTSS